MSMLEDLKLSGRPTFDNTRLIPQAGKLPRDESEKYDTIKDKCSTFCSNILRHTNRFASKVLVSTQNAHPCLLH